MGSKVVAACESRGEVDKPGVGGQRGTPELAVHLGHFAAQGVVPDRQPQEFSARGRNDRRQQDLSAGCGALCSQPKEGLSRLTDDGAPSAVIHEGRRDEIVAAALNEYHSGFKAMASRSYRCAICANVSPPMPRLMTSTRSSSADVGHLAILKFPIRTTRSFWPLGGSLRLASA